MKGMSEWNVINNKRRYKENFRRGYELAVGQRTVVGKTIHRDLETDLE